MEQLPPPVVYALEPLDLRHHAAADVHRDGTATALCGVGGWPAARLRFNARDPLACRPCARRWQLMSAGGA